MFTSMTARVSTNTYCLARTRRFSKRSENSVGRVTHEREAPTDTVQLVKVFLGCQVHTIATVPKDGATELYEAFSSPFSQGHKSFLY